MQRTDPLQVVFFGTYDADRHPRVRVLAEGFRAHGDDVVEVNEPLALDTAARVRILRQPWRAPLLLVRLIFAWIRLVPAALRHRTPDAVLVGYMGHLDVHLARLLWPRTPIVLDHMISLADTAADRGVEASGRTRLLASVDRAALRRADLILVDTEEHLGLVPGQLRERAIVVPVGADEAWFEPSPVGGGEDTTHVVFFGLYTPLQGAPTIGEAIAELEDRPHLRFTMVGSGQDLEETRRRAGDAGNVRWMDWLDPPELQRVVANADVCLGIFGTGPKALRVVPNKVYQGAAAGCAVITSDTPPQRRAFGDAATFVAPGDAAALSRALARLAEHPDELAAARQASAAAAARRFRPDRVVVPLRSSLRAGPAVRD